MFSNFHMIYCLNSIGYAWMMVFGSRYFEVSICIICSKVWLRGFQGYYITGSCFCVSPNLQGILDGKHAHILL